MALELPGSLLGEPLAMLKHLFGFVLNTGGGFNVFIFGAIDRLLTIRRKDGYYRCIDTCLHVYIICILYIYIYILFRSGKNKSSTCPVGSDQING